MDLATIIGLALGFGALIGAFVLEGGNPAGLVGITAAMIVFGGTAATLLISYPLEMVMTFPKVVMKAFKTPPDRRADLVEELVGLADLARRDGLLALESKQSSDPFMNKALMLVVDGTDPDVTRDILLRDVEGMETRHKHGIEMLSSLGGYAPTLGIIGTVMGLIHVLSNLEDPSKLAESIAAAFLATLYGVFSANIIWLPLAGKLKVRSALEVEERMIIVEGALSLQAGDNPRILREKLNAFVGHGQKEKKEKAAPAGAAGRASAMAEGGE